jgi:putative nucleotidyltransferase with HDIG domain
MTVTTLPSVGALREAFRGRLEGGRLDLPILPEAAGQVMQATSDGECDARKLSSIIHRDPSLAGHVLRLANSPLYMPTTPIVSLQQAVSRLGMKTIREIALAITCESRVFRVKGFEAEMRGFFRHSYAAGLYAQEIARLRRWNVEEGFLCGMLHDVGKPVVLQTLLDLSAGAPTVPREELLGLVTEFHAEAGARLVASWKLPVRLGETIRYHHHPHDAPTASRQALMTALADELSHLTIGEPDEEREEALGQHPALEPLNMYPDELDALLARRAQIAAQVEAIG